MGSYCIPCPDGNYTDYKAATYCKGCIKGRTSNSEHTSCIQCPVGYFAPKISSPECLPCEEGYYSSTTGSSDCTKCPDGQTSKKGDSSCYDI